MSDYQEKRFQAALAAMQGFIVGARVTTKATQDEVREAFTAEAVAYADALLEALGTEPGDPDE